MCAETEHLDQNENEMMWERQKIRERMDFAIALIAANGWIATFPLCIVNYAMWIRLAMLWPSEYNLFHKKNRKKEEKEKKSRGNRQK